MKSVRAILGGLEPNAAGHFLRRNRNGYLGSAGDPIRFLVLSRNHLVRTRFWLRERPCLFRSRWNNIRRRSNNRDNRSLRARSNFGRSISFGWCVRTGAIWSAGNLQEMSASLRLQPFLLPILWAETGLTPTPTRNLECVVTACVLPNLHWHEVRE